MTEACHELTKDLALRIGLASRELSPLLPPQVLLTSLQQLFGGQLPNREGLKGITPCQLRPLLQGALPDLSGKRLKSALHWLTDWEPEASLAADPPLATHTPAAAGTIRVAMATTGRGAMDGHFASCPGFMIYDVSADEVHPQALRLVPPLALGEDKVAARLALLRDCLILVVASIGGPAAARSTRAGLWTIKVTDEASPQDWLGRFRQVLAGTPPPWLRRALASPS